MRSVRKFEIEPSWSSVALRWNGIQLDHMRVPPVETPALSMQHVFLHVQLARPSSIDIVEGKRTWQRLTPGQICLTPPGWSGALAFRETSEFLTVQLELRLLENAMQEEPLVNEILLKRGFEDQQILHICQALDAEARSGGPSGKLFVESLATALAARLLSRYSRQAFVSVEYRGRLPRAKLNRVEEFVAANLANSFALADLANLAGMSPFHFARLFRDSLGTSPHQYVIGRRMEKAKELLIYSDLKIAEICRELGYESQSHFSETFRRAVGAAPSVFRRDRKSSKNGSFEQVSASRTETLRATLNSK